MEVLQALVVVVWMVLPLAVLIAPPVVAATHHRTTVVWGALYVVALGPVGAHYYALSENMDWADRTGGQGSMFAGGGWLVAAVAVAAGSCWYAVRTRRSSPATA